jgi:hypothetical protein
VVGLVGALVALALLAGACSGDDSQQSEETTTTVAPTTTSTTEAPLDERAQKDPLYFVPEVGTCYDKRKVDGADNKQVDTILLLDCQLPHQYEIFATLDFPSPEDGDRTWPGDEALRDFARANCSATFEEYVGEPYETSVLEIGYQLPPEDNFYANQVVGCYVYDPSKDQVVDGRPVQGRTAGTARGSAR